MKTLLWIFGLSTLHFVIAMISLIIALIPMCRSDFDLLKERSAIVESIYDIFGLIFQILSSPGLQICMIFDIHQNPFEWLLFFLNSLLWGTVLYGSYVACKHFISRRREGGQ
jgi:hypothetical protein